MGGAVPKRWRSVWCMLYAMHVSTGYAPGPRISVAFIASSSHGEARNWGAALPRCGCLCGFYSISAELALEPDPHYSSMTKLYSAAPEAVRCGRDLYFSISIIFGGTFSPNTVCGRTRDFRSRDGACRGLARPRQAPPLAPTPEAHRTPGLPALSPPRTSPHATLFRSRAVFPADSGRAIRARGGALGC
jgi:hypothetical protein